MQQWQSNPADLASRSLKARQLVMTTLDASGAQIPCGTLFHAKHEQSLHPHEGSFCYDTRKQRIP